ncbi:TadA family conjugal transfer-associated ATPase [Rarobacter faecitabidus]|nr:TadA family conjugal transfer-associated ATPase [Rarobacter faecitabidus]
MQGRASQLADVVRRELASANEPLNYASVRARVASHTITVTQGEQSRLIDQVWGELTGAGPLQRVLTLPGVTDVLVNGAEEIWLDRGDGLERADLDLGSPAEVRSLAVRLAASAGQRLDDASPTADGQLADGTRLHAVLAPIADGPAVISLRVVRRHPWSLADLVERAMIPREWEELLVALVTAKVGILVSGATGTGKSTLMGALLALLDPAERLIVIEETRELCIDHAHVVTLQARRANAEGAGEVGLSRLVREALRMRPDRIAVGEVRGAELGEMLTAFNTGHEGGIGTIHANAASDVPARLVSLGLIAGVPEPVLIDQAMAALRVVCHVQRTSSGTRHIREIGLLESSEQAGRARLRVDPALSWNGEGEPRRGPAYERLVELLRGGTR